LRLTIVGASLIAISVTCFAYSIAMESAPLLIVASICLALVLNDLWYLSSIDAEGIVVRRRIDRLFVRELELFDVVVEVENRCQYSIPRLEVRDLLPPTIEPLSGPPTVSIRLPRGYRVVSSYRARALCPGEHVLKKTVVCVYGISSTMCRCFARSIESRIVAIPLSVGVELEIRSMSKLVGLVRGFSSYGLYDVEGFRSYEYGDDPRKIVWKVFARERRLVIRVDRGESTARIMLVVLLRRYSWIVGEKLNTLAHRLLRLAQSVAERFAMPGVSLDLALLTSEAPRIATGVALDVENLYRLYSWVAYLNGFRDSVTRLLDYMRLRGLDPEHYDYLVLVTDLYTLANEITSFLEVLSRFRRGIVLAVIEKGMDLDNVSIASFCSRLIERVGFELEIVSEGLEVLRECS